MLCAHTHSDCLDINDLCLFSQPSGTHSVLWEQKENIAIRKGVNYKVAPISPEWIWEGAYLYFLLVLFIEIWDAAHYFLTLKWKP